MIQFDLLFALAAGVLWFGVSLFQAMAELCASDDPPAPLGRVMEVRGHLMVAALRVAVALVAVALVVVLDRAVPVQWSWWLETLVFGVLLYVALRFLPWVWRSPKRVEGFARRVAPWAVGIRAVLWPLAWVVSRTGRVAERVLPREEVDMETIQDAIEATENQREEDKKILSGLVVFGERRVGEIMTPRVDVDALNAAWDFDRVRQTVVESSYSRLPIYEGSVDRIGGVVHIKDLLPYLDRGADFGWQQVARAAYFVPEEMKLSELLAEFQSRRTHMCIVVDEYGGTVGIATLEDVVEEVVGEISDESDVQEALYDRLEGGGYGFDGSFHLIDFERVLPEIVPRAEELESLEASIAGAKGEADTLAGLMLELKGAFFAADDRVSLGSMTFRAIQVEGYRITRVEVSFAPGDPDQ